VACGLERCCERARADVSYPVSYPSPLPTRPPCPGSAAIPVDTLKYQVNTIIKDGKVTRPAIGISYMSYGQARALGVDRGVLVLDVPEQSSADKAGLRGSYRSRSGEIVIGDVITAVNSDVVDDDIELFRAIDKFKPGDRVTLTVSRFDEDDNEQELRIPITLQEYVDAPDGLVPLTMNYGVKL